MFYAQLNEQNICVGISSLSGYVETPELVLIESMNNDFRWRKYISGEWSVEKFEPAGAPLAVTLEDRIKALEDIQLANMLA